MIVARSGAVMGNIQLLEKWGSVNHQMAVPVPSISCCIFNNKDFFYQEQNELAFNRDTCCHLVICWLLIASHCNVQVVFPSKSVPLRSVRTACTNDCGTERSGDGKYSMTGEIPKPFQYRSELFLNRWELTTVQPLPLGPSTKCNNRSLDMNIRLFP